jgi:hypothetical protein
MKHQIRVAQGKRQEDQAGPLAVLTRQARSLFHPEREAKGAGPFRACP